MSHIIDLTGKRFGRLLVLSQDFNCKRSKTTKWVCKCDCGNVKSINGASLRRGLTKSCGCLQSELTSERCRIYKGDAVGERLHSIWHGMKERCNRESCISYPLYGAIGISIYDEWNSSFLAFYEWATQNGYAIGLSIDRVDNSKGYSPDNCRWVTPKDQSNNTRRNVFLTYKGESKTIAQWAEITGIKPYTLANRKRSGWTDEECLEVPVIIGNNQKAREK